MNKFKPSTKTHLISNAKNRYLNEPCMYLSASSSNTNKQLCALCAMINNFVCRRLLLLSRTTGDTMIHCGPQNSTYKQNRFKHIRLNPYQLTTQYGFSFRFYFPKMKHRVTGCFLLLFISYNIIYHIISILYIQFFSVFLVGTLAATSSYVDYKIEKLSRFFFLIRTVPFPRKELLVFVKVTVERRYQN